MSEPTSEEIETQLDQVMGEKVPLFGPNTIPARILALHGQLTAAKARERAEHESYMARLAGGTVAASAARPEAIRENLDQQIEEIVAKEDANFARLLRGGLPPDEEQRLIGQRLDWNRARQQLLAQRDGVDQAVEAGRDSENFRRQVGHIGLEGPALERAVDLHGVAQGEGIGAAVLPAILATRDAEVDLAARLAAGEPKPTPESVETIWAPAWGGDFQNRVELFWAAWDLLEATRPALAKEVARSGLLYTLKFANAMADLGAALLDPLTPRGMARRIARATADE